MKTAVVFDLVIDEPDLFPEEELSPHEQAMFWMFALCEGVTLIRKEVGGRSTGALTYVGVDFDRVFSSKDEPVWLGALTSTRSSKPVEIFKDGEGRHRRKEGAPIRTTASDSLFAFDPKTNRVVAWVSSQFPYQRFVSYVRKAALAMPLESPARLVPAQAELSIEEQMRSFETLSRVSVQFTHSQSPGVESIDRDATALGNPVFTYSAEAKRGESLPVSTLLRPSGPLGRAIRHIQVNSRNGVATMRGRTREGLTTLRSSDRIRREQFTLQAATQVGLADCLLPLARRPDLEFHERLLRRGQAREGAIERVHTVWGEGSSADLLVGWVFQRMRNKKVRDFSLASIARALRLSTGDAFEVALWFCSGEVPLFELFFTFRPPDESATELLLDEVVEAQRSGALLHPESGNSYEEFDRFLFPHFATTEYCNRVRLGGGAW